MGSQFASLVAYLAVSVGLLAFPITTYLLRAPHDWAILAQVPERLASGRLYDLSGAYYFTWSPMAAWLMAGIFVPLGYSIWLGMHLAVLPLLRDWRLIGAVLLSVPFWIDTIVGNSIVFIYVAGALALNGSRLGSLAYLALFVLMPRPVQAPLVGWLLWKQADTRIPFATMIAIAILATAASGYASEWLAALLSFATANYGNDANFGPTRLLGGAWLIVGIPLAAWLSTTGRVGLAGLALSPYVWPQHLLMLLLDLGPRTPSPPPALIRPGESHDDR